AGAQTASAAVTGLTGSPVPFTATAAHGAATQIAVEGGNNQSAQVGSTVATPPSVIVSDRGTNPVPGVAVTFAVASGGGPVDPTTAVATTATRVAAVNSWKLGPSAGANTLTATASALTGSPLTFTATGTACSVSAATSTVSASPAGLNASHGASVPTYIVTERDIG